MRLLAIELESFKGVAERQRIEFAPLTLIFGANSAGKSTVLQALLYLHEVLERGAADVDRTELGGTVLDLGGFARLVHRHEMTRAVVLRAEFATAGGLDRLGRELLDFPFPDLDDDIEVAWLELTIRHRTTAAFTGAVVERAVIGVAGDSEPLVWLELGASLREGEPLNVRVNLGHPLLATDTRELEGAIVSEADGSKHPLTTQRAPVDLTDAWEKIAVPEAPLRDGSVSRSGSEARTHSTSGSRTGPKERSHSSSGAGDEEGGGYGGGFGAGAGLGEGSGFGDGRSLPVFAVSRSRMAALPPLGEPLRVIPFGDDDADVAATVAQVRTFLEMVVLGTVSQLAEALRDALYIGPLRALPPRGFLYERVGRITSWADGLAAWDLLLADRSTLVEDTNKWLTRLGAGCQLVVQQLYDSAASAEELTDGHVDKTARRLLLDTGSGSLVLPSEVGAGVSQVIPVVVAALQREAGLALVEQPEIHVHPAMQVGLGDLLIDAATRDGRAFLIETHSEHLILRLLRRIRETTEGELGDDAPKFSPDKLSVIYVENTPDGVNIRQLRVDELGEFKDRWPKGFFAERMGELL